MLSETADLKTYIFSQYGPYLDADMSVACCPRHAPAISQR